ncbi:hypothetical protein PQX77_004317 [Marasmius sp. AFHP31]|nr:hypothetical protein PQX77_004317 [Marasmius sp. AFHP31]
MTAYSQPCRQNTAILWHILYGKLDSLLRLSTPPLVIGVAANRTPAFGHALEEATGSSEARYGDTVPPKARRSPESPTVQTMRSSYNFHIVHNPLHITIADKAHCDDEDSVRIVLCKLQSSIDPYSFLKGYDDHAEAGDDGDDEEDGAYGGELSPRKRAVKKKKMPILSAPRLWVMSRPSLHQLTI